MRASLSAPNASRAGARPVADERARAAEASGSPAVPSAEAACARRSASAFTVPVLSSASWSWIRKYGASTPSIGSAARAGAAGTSNSAAASAARARCFIDILQKNGSTDDRERDRRLGVTGNRNLRGRLLGDVNQRAPCDRFRLGEDDRVAG